jgi:hypothetical protein
MEPYSPGNGDRPFDVDLRRLSLSSIAVFRRPRIFGPLNFLDCQLIHARTEFRAPNLPQA